MGACETHCAKLQIDETRGSRHRVSQIHAVRPSSLSAGLFPLPKGAVLPPWETPLPAHGFARPEECYADPPTSGSPLLPVKSHWSPQLGPSARGEKVAPCQPSSRGRSLTLLESMSSRPSAGPSSVDRFACGGGGTPPHKAAEPSLPPPRPAATGTAPHFRLWVAGADGGDERSEAASGGGATAAPGSSAAEACEGGSPQCCSSSSSRCRVSRESTDDLVDRFVEAVVARSCEIRGGLPAGLGSRSLPSSPREASSAAASQRLSAAGADRGL